MTKARIKFSTQTGADFAQELRQNIKTYFEDRNVSKFGNTNLTFKSIFMTSLYVIPFFLMIFGVIDGLGLSLLAWAIMGFGMAGIGMGIMHDANHGAFSKYPWVNTLVSKSMYFIGGYPANWRHQHNTLHHGFTNIDGHDEDIDPVAIIRLSPHKPHYGIHRFQHYYAWFLYGLMTISWASYRDFKQLYFYSKQPNFKNDGKSTLFLFADLLLAKVVYFGVFLALPIYMMPLAWGWVLLGFMVMHFVCGFILAIIFQTAHVMTTTAFPNPENGQLETNWAVHQLLTTTNYSPRSRVFSWFIGGLNFQVEHHLFPQISHVHYKKLSAMVKKTAEKHKFPYYVEPSFMVALGKHYQMLKMLGRKSVVS